jgi:hypothetical protein
VPADSRVEFSGAAAAQNFPAVAAGESSFGSSSYLDPELTTNHVILLTGLSPGTRYSYQTLSRADTNTYLSGVYQFSTAGMTLMDNPIATFTGEWTEASSSPDKYQTNYLFASTVPGAASATATWRPNLTTQGKYDVFVWYPEGANRANNAPYLISFNGGSTNILVNQQSGGGAWQLIASGVEFARGTNGFVRLGNNAGASVVVADAVRFDYVEAQDFPTGPAIPTWWGDFFFHGPTDASLDADGDGYTTAQEYVMGTTPTNVTSQLQVAASASNTTVNVSFWPAHANRSYQLRARADLGMPGWETTAAPVTFLPEGRGQFNLNSTNAPQHFFRLKVQLTTNENSAGFLSVPAPLLVAPNFAEAFCGPFRLYVR